MVTKEEVEHVARLARLGLLEEEKELFAKQLSAVLEFASSLNKLDTKDVLATSHAIPMKNVFRQDQVIACENVDDILANAPLEEGRMFKVPKILE